MANFELSRYIQQAWKDERNMIEDVKAAATKKSDNSIVRYVYS